MVKLTEKIIMPRKDAEYYSKLGGVNKFIKSIDKNTAVCEVSIKIANYLKRLGNKYSVYVEKEQVATPEVKQPDTQTYPSEEII